MQTPGAHNFFINLHPMQRMFISISVAVIAVLITQSLHMQKMFPYLIAWLIFAITYLSLSWVVIFKRPVSQIKKMANKDDGSLVFVHIMVFLSSLAGMVAVLLLLISQKTIPHAQEVWFLPMGFLGMLLSWMMVHTLYTFHYAHKYYNTGAKSADSSYEGLDFPGDEAPDYIDFAYFSFVLGCTFQVSDVAITSKSMRRTALAHGLISFALNTFVVALTINFVAGLMG